MSRPAFGAYYYDDGKSSIFAVTESVRFIEDKRSFLKNSCIVC